MNSSIMGVDCEERGWERGGRGREGEGAFGWGEVQQVANVDGVPSNHRSYVPLNWSVNVLEMRWELLDSPYNTCRRIIHGFACSGGF